MNNLESYVNKDIKTEIAQFVRSYHTALHVFDTFDEKDNKNPYSALLDKCHLRTILNSRGEMSCVFVNKINQGNYLFDFGPDTENACMTIFHHNDMDGYMSASIVYNANVSQNNEGGSGFEFIEYNYGDIKAPTEKIERFVKDHQGRYKIAVIVDLSLPLGQESLLENIIYNYDKIIWIDHHATSLNVALELAKKPDCYRRMSIFIDTRMSSAMQAYCLTNKYDPNYTYKDLSIAPQIVSYYDRKDDRRFPLFYTLGLWMNQYIFDFNMNDPTHPFWNEILFDEKLIDVLKTGESLTAIRMLRDKVLYEADSKYVFTGFGLTIIGINGNGNSNRFTDPLVNPDTIKVLFRRVDNHKFTFSAYSDSIDVKRMNIGAVLRDKLGGGGHPGAAGATVDMATLLKEHRRANLTGFQRTILNQESARYSNAMSNAFSLFSEVLLEAWIQYIDSRKTNQ